MTWVAVGVGAISAIGGMFGSKSTAKAQKEANRIARDTLNFNKKRYEDYQTQYGGLTDMVVGDAEKGVTADLGGVSASANADTATHFANAKEALDNQQQRMGISPNSGRAESSNRQLATNQAIAAAGNITNARNREREYANDTTWNRRYGVYQQGNSLINGAANGVNYASNNLQSTMQSGADNASNAANQALSGGISSITQGLLGNQNVMNKLNGILGGTTRTGVSQMDTATKGLKVNGTQAGSGVIYDNISSVMPKNNNNTGSFLG